MRKRETLIESKKYVNKFDYNLSKQEFVQTIDSHLEALDQIDELKDKGQWHIERWHEEESRANLLQLELDELKHKLWLKTRVAETYQQALADHYRPHIEENKMLRKLVDDITRSPEEIDSTPPDD